MLNTFLSIMAVSPS